MLRFFRELEYELKYHPDPEKLFTQEFETGTNKHQWLQRANGLFEQERFLLASRCFEKADTLDYAAWSLGSYFLKKKMNKPDGKIHLLRASELFYEDGQYEKVLRISCEMLHAVEWEEKPPQFVRDEVLAECQVRCPYYLSDKHRLRIDIFTDKWNRIDIEDVKKEYSFVGKRRGFPGLMKFIRNLSDDDVSQIAEMIPCIIGDLKYESQKYAKAVELFLLGGDIPKAKESSLKLVQFLKTRKDVTANEVVKLNIVYKNIQIQQGDNMTQKLLFSLIQKPEVAAEDRPSQYLENLGTCLIRFIVKSKKVDRTLLFSFCSNSFHGDVLEELRYKYKDDLKKVVLWFLSRNNQTHALSFISERISVWEDKELENFVTKQKLYSEDIGEELFKRQKIVDSINIFLKCHKIERAYYVANDAVSSIEGAEEYGWKIVLLLSGFDQPIERSLSNLQLILKLYEEPEVMIKKDRSTSIKRFGPKLVQRCVFERINKKCQDGEMGLNVLDVLNKFGGKAKMSYSEAMDTFHKYKHMSKTAERFFISHITQWTLNELQSISEKFGFHNKQLANEYEFRKDYVAAANIFITIGYYNDAIKASDEAISTPDLLAQNSPEIQRLWGNLAKNDQISFEKIQKDLIPSSMIAARVFLKVGCILGYPKDICEDALSTRDKASKNFCEVQRMWLTEDLQSKYPEVQKELDSNSKLHILLLLLQDPAYVVNYGDNSTLISHYHGSFWASVIHDAVLTSYLHRYSICGMDPAEILRQFSFNSSKIDVFRSLHKMAENSKATKHYANTNVQFWSKNISSFEDSDIHLLLSFDLQIPGMEDTLEERKMFSEALKLHLEKKDIDQAIKLSNSTLARKNIDDYVESFVELWECAGFTTESSEIPKDCKLWLLLYLYHDPTSISITDIGQKYLSNFGHNIVKGAIQARIHDKNKMTNCLQVLKNYHKNKDEEKPNSRPKGKQGKKINAQKARKNSRKSKKKTK